MRRSLDTLDHGRPAAKRRLHLGPTNLVCEYEDFAERYSCSIVHNAYLVGTSRARKEVQLKDLDHATCRLYEASLAKEWNSWLNFGAVELLTEQQVQWLPKGVKIIGARWVHTDKAAKLRVPGTASENLPVQAKSRLVVQGHRAVVDIRSESPTASLSVINLLLSVASMKRWIVKSADASNAYLQGEAIDRLLVLRAPNPPPPGVAPGQLMRAKGSIYGTNDARR